MSFPTDDGLFILDTDASDETIGAVLSQVQLGREKVIAFGSQSLGKSERNYCATDQGTIGSKVLCAVLQTLSPTEEIRSEVRS